MYRISTSSCSALIFQTGRYLDVTSLYLSFLNSVHLYLLLLQVRVQGVDASVGTQEFEVAYRALMKARLDLIKANDEYNKQLLVFDQTNSKFSKLKSRIDSVKRAAERAYIEELRDVIDIEVPKQFVIEDIA